MKTPEVGGPKGNIEVLLLLYCCCEMFLCTWNWFPTAVSPGYDWGNVAFPGYNFLRLYYNQDWSYDAVTSQPWIPRNRGKALV